MADHAVILGGGIAGISAAVRLAEAGYKVTLTEKKPYLGGRLYSALDRKSGDWVDNGQHILMGCYRETFALLEKLGTRDGVSLQKNLDIGYRDNLGNIDNLYCPGLPAPLHLLAGLLQMRSFGCKDYLAALRMGLALRKDHPARKGESVLDFCQRLKQTSKLNEMMWYPMAISAINEKPDSACAELFTTVLKNAFFAGREESKIGFPSVPLQALHGDHVSKFLADHQGKVLLSHKAVRLEREGKRIRSVIFQNGEKENCDYCISTLPPRHLQELITESQISQSIRVPDLGSSPILSVYLWFDKSFTDEQICCLQNCAYEWILFRSNFMKTGSHRQFCVCLLVSAARHYQTWTREDLVKAGLYDVHQTYPESQKSVLTNSMVFWEPHATFSAKPLTGCKRPGVMTEIPNFFLAGDWTDTGLPATIEGAVVSGKESAEAITHIQ